jgi:predicted acyltransferase
VLKGAVLLIMPSFLPHPNRRLRAKGNEEEALNRIKYAFDALYEGTCLNDDQKDFTGQRFIYAADFRLLLTVTGRMV